MTALKPYSSYRPTDLPWLGQIPAHWNVKRLKFIAPASTSKLTNKPEDLPYVGLENIESGTGRLFMEIQPETVESNVAIFERGDILFGKLRPYLAKVAEPNFRGSCTTEILPLHPNKINSRYLFYSLLSPAFIEHVNSMTYGTKMPRANWEQIGNLAISIPPLEEQQIIATYLDQQTAKIDALIAKKQRLLDLLAEQRAALISQAVTKGLNPDVKTKDSGVVWLGQVPSHWEVKRMKYLSTEPLQYGANESAEIDDPSLPRFIRITDIREDGTLRDETFKSLPEEVAEPFLLKYGDILFARSGATVGKSFMYRKYWGKACYAGYLIRVRVNPELAKPEFISYFANSSLYWNWISSIFIQATIQNVSAEKYGNMFLPVPSLFDQEKIVEYLDYQTKRLTDLATKVETAIERLREHRTALISSVVTGKVDVTKGA